MDISIPETSPKTVKDFAAGTLIGVNDDGNETYYVVTDEKHGLNAIGNAIGAVNLKTGEICAMNPKAPATGYPDAVTYPYGHPRQWSDETKPKAILENGTGIYSLVKGNGKSRYFAILSPCDSSVIHKIQNACANLEDDDIDAQAKQLVADVKREYGIDLAFLPVKDTFAIS